jgi:hypothetical protein
MRYTLPALSTRKVQPRRMCEALGGVSSEEARHVFLDHENPALLRQGGNLDPPIPYWGRRSGRGTAPTQHP